jgi:hypothetical protein
MAYFLPAFLISKRNTVYGIVMSVCLSVYKRTKAKLILVVYLVTQHPDYAVTITSG